MRTTPDLGRGLSLSGFASQAILFLFRRYSMTKEYPKLIDDRNAKNVDKKAILKVEEQTQPYTARHIISSGLANDDIFDWMDRRSDTDRR